MIHLQPFKHHQFMKMINTKMPVGRIFIIFDRVIKSIGRINHEYSLLRIP